MGKATRGQLYVPTDEFNRHVVASDDFHRRRALGDAVRPPPFAPLSTDVIKIVNGTGGALRAGEVVELASDPLTTPSRLHPWFVADSPDGTRAFAIMLQDVPSDSDAMGEAQVSGRCLALVDFNSASDQWANVENGNDVLQSDPDAGSVRVLVPPSGTGEQLVWVRFESPASVATLGIPGINNSGQILPPGAILEPATTVSINRADYIVAEQPGTTFKRRWLVNGPTPVDPLATFLGSWLDDLSGFAAIDPGSASYLQSAYGWGPRPGSFLLYPSYFGFTIEGVTSYTLFGTLLAHARQHEVNTLIGLKLNEDLLYDSSAKAKIWHRDHQRKGKETEFNPLSVFDGLKLLEGGKIDKDIVIDAVWNGDAWELSNAACAKVQPAQSQQSSQSRSGGANQYNQLVSPSSPSFPSL